MLKGAIFSASRGPLLSHSDILDCRQIWRVAGRESSCPELLESPQTSLEVPQKLLGKFLGSFPGSSLSMGSDSPEVSPNFPESSPDFPEGQPLSGSPFFRLEIARHGGVIEKSQASWRAWLRLASFVLLLCICTLLSGFVLPAMQPQNRATL